MYLFIGSYTFISLKVERERDKERLENKRSHEQLKKIYDEEKDENNKKLEEVNYILFISKILRN